MNSAAQKRLYKDLSRLIQENPEGINALPLDDNMFIWEGMIEGLADTIWQGGVFRIKLKFTSNYPNEPPSVEFTSKMFHPNVYPDGRVCLGVLKEKWNAQFDVMLLLHTVRMLLSDPNPNSPANNTVAVIFEKDKKEYERRVRAVVENSWEM